MRTGGIEAMISALSNEMSKDNQVTVCSIFEPQQNWIFWNQLDSRISRLTLNKRKTGFSLKEIFKICKLIYKGKYDVINMHGFFVYYLLSILLFHKKVKFFYTVHSDAEKENTRWDNKFYKIKKRFFSKGYMHPITISPTSKQSFKNYYDCESDLIPNGIKMPDIKNFKNSIPVMKRVDSATSVFVNIGRIDTPKNQVALCEMFTEMIKKGCDIMLVIAGPIANPDIFAKIKPLLCDRIIYLGEIHNSQEVLANSDALVMPSIWEGLPVTLLESMSVGCVPICTPVGGMKDVITNGKNGFLSENINIESFKDKIFEFLRLSKEDRLKISNNAMQTVSSKYSISVTAKQYLQLYNQYK